MQSCFQRLCLFFSIIACSTCVLKQRNSDGEAPTANNEAPQNRPDTRGIPPKSQYTLGATFYNAEVRSANDGPASTGPTLNIPPFTDQSCYFRSMFDKSRFRWSFKDSRSDFLNQRQLDVDLAMNGLPIVDQRLRIDGMSSDGSVSLQVPNLQEGVFGFWQLDPFSQKSYCDISIVRVQTADGAPAGANFKGPFRMDVFMTCKLSSFGSFNPSFLTFDSELSCTGDVNSKSGKWFISSSVRKVFELQSTPMVKDVAKSYCANQFQNYSLPTLEELRLAKSEIALEFFKDLSKIPPLWIKSTSSSKNPELVSDLSLESSTSVQPSDNTTGHVICVH